MILTAVMAHQRQLIRNAVAAMLVAGSTAAGARVTTTRVEPHKKTELPAISVYSLSEEVKEWEAPRELTRELKLEIAGWVAHSDTYPADQAMDDLAAQIEAVMNADWYLTAFFGVTGVNTSLDTLTIPSHGLSTGAAPTAVQSSGTIPGGLVAATEYWVIVVDANTIQLASSLQNALDGTAIDITSSGSGTIKLAVSTAADSILESTEQQVVESDGRSEPLVGIVTLTYAVTYRTIPAPPLGLPDFTSASVTIDPNDTPNIPTVQDTFNPQGS